MNDKYLQNVAFIGIGGCGINMLESWQKQLPHNSLFIAVDNDRKRLELADNFTCKINLRGTTPLCSYSSKVVLQASMGEAVPQLISILKGKERVILLAGLGGGIGRCLSQYIYELLIPMNLKVTVVLVLPFSFEGKKRRNLAEEALKSFDTVNNKVVCFNQELMETSPKGISIIDAFEGLNENSFELLKRLHPEIFLKKSFLSRCFYCLELMIKRCDAITRSIFQS